MKARHILTSLLLAAMSIALPAQNLKKSVTWDNFNANPAPLPQIGQLNIHHSSIDMDSWWSVGVETLDRDFADFSKYKEYIGQTGVGYARLQSGWAKTEQVKGQYDFAWIDRHVDGLRGNGLKPWICLCYGNPIYSEHGFDLNAKLFPDGPVMDGWLNYVKATVSHFKGRVPMYEIWNEPDGSGLDSYGLYANLCVRTAKVIHEVDPDAKIAAFGICSPDRPYIRQALAAMKELGGIELIDYITYHTYWKHPETSAAAIEALREDAKTYSPRIELLQGESGCPGQLEYGHAMSFIEWTEYSQVKWDLRHMLTDFSLGIPSSVFTMVDLNYGWMLQSFGLIRMNLKSQPIYKRPKFYGVQHMTSVITGDMRPAPVAVKTASVRPVSSAGLAKDGRTVGVMLWFGDGKPGDGLERTAVDLTIAGADIKDPVYVDMITGKVHDLGSTIAPGGSVASAETAVTGVMPHEAVEIPQGSMSFRGLPLWDAPVLIMGRADLDASWNDAAPEGGPVHFADPFILCEKGKYYLYGTHSADGIGVLESDDMVHWHNVGDTLCLALHRKDAVAERWFWAPEVYKVGRRYVMYFSNDEHICAATSSSPTGPFVVADHRPMRDERGIDNTLYTEKGQAPRIFWVRFDHGNVIWSAELEKDMTTIREDTKRFCIRTDQEWELADPAVNEGPFILKHGGYYYLTYSGNCTPSQMYGIGYATSKSLDGPWEKYEGNPIFQNPGDLVGVGHHSFFKDARGVDRIVFHSHYSHQQFSPRTTAISTYHFEPNPAGGPDILVISPDYVRCVMD